MDSPSLQSTTTAAAHPSRARAYTSFSAQSTVNKRGAIQKRTADNDRNRSISVSQADRLYRLAAEQQANFEHPVPSTAGGGIQWITPQHSPQPQPFTSEQLIEPFPQWTAPTPPRSDSGIPSLSVDSNEEPVTTGISVAPEFAFDHPSSTSAEMRYVFVRLGVARN